MQAICYRKKIRMKKTDKTVGSRKEALTSLAVDMMQTRGFSALGLRELAQAACIQVASLYSHFDSKNAVALQAMALYSKREREELAEIDQAPAGNVRLHRYVQMFSNTLKDDRRLCLGLMLAVERNSLPEEVMQEIRLFATQNIDWLAAAWDLGRSDKSIVSTLTGVAAAPIIFGSAEGIMAFSLLQTDPPAIFEEHLLRLLGALGVQSE